MENRVATTVNGSIAEILINRPDSRNAISKQMWQSLTEQLRELEQNPTVRVVIITGEGEQAFSAGADFSDLAEVADDETLIDSMLLAIEETMAAIEQMSKPVIAKVNGAAIGGGCELATSCDIRIVADHAKFGIPAGKLGIAITWQDTRRLSSLVGVSWARDLLMTGQVIDAKTALQIGLVTRVVSATDLDRQTKELAEQVAKMAPLTLKAAKFHTLDVARGHELTSREEGFAIAKEAWASEEFKKRVNAVQQKRSTSVSIAGGEKK